MNWFANDPLVREAASFANWKHGQQLDDEGEPYFHAHLGVVAALVGEVTDDCEVIAAAYLHDTLEDTNATYEELVEKFGSRVADLVNEVTHEGQADSVGFYFPRLKTREAILIKFADRMSNLSRMSAWTPERQAHYLKRSKFWKSEQV
jgi:(p)ppGpp synthase/HD superfamily hydrolase